MLELSRWYGLRICVMIGVIGPERWLFNKNDCTSVDRGYGTHISMAVEPANIAYMILLCVTHGHCDASQTVTFPA